MKRVLYIVANPFSFSTNPVGGNISSASGVVTGFLMDGYHVDVVTDTNIPTLQKNSDKLTTIYYPYRSLRSVIPRHLSGFLGKVFKKLDGIFFRIVMKKKIMSLVNENQYTFCYMRASYHGATITSILNTRNLKLVLEVNKPLSMAPYNKKEVIDWPNPTKRVRVPKAERDQYEAATLITVDSSLRAKWITDFVGEKFNNKMIINPNGVNTKMFSPSPKTKESCFGFKKLPGDILVGMASSFRWYNDIEELCEILCRALAECDKLKYIIVVGDLKKEAELKTKISAYGLNKSTKILSQIPFNMMPNLLNECDVVLSHFNFHNKWPHNCSIKHLEYLALGKPTVATDVGEVNFAIEHGKNGLLCEEGNIDMFANSIVRLANDPALRKRLGAAGRQKALEELDWQFNVQKIIKSLH
ncbi:glycosyltransferase family 4 protein [Planktomarina temperata]|nr:glycosyltransferase family 4 protein [Planktomarina temperata]